MQHIQDENIKKSQMIMTLGGRAPDWYMKFSIVPVGVSQKTLDQIQVGMIDEFKKLKSESRCTIEIK